MSTPTPSHPHHPNSATKKAPGHVSTPSHLNFSSPAPRSVPSPTATRKEHAGKTPVNHPTTSSQGSKTFGGTPMVHSLSQTGNTIGLSPGANVMSFGTPSGLGLEGLTPGQMNLATPASMAGLGIGMSMSELGLAPLPKKRNEDEERRAKMRRILKSIGKPMGRVSEDSIARIGRRVGLANDIDHLSPSERERGVGNRVISTAGTKILVEIDLKDHIPRGVQVTFDGENEESAGKVLLEDLRVANSVALTAKLDRFAANLERLAKIDRLCSNQVNCFEALSGIYTSLHRLYEQEGFADNEFDVMRKRSGWPRAHARGRLGTSLEYWREATHETSNEHAEGEMEIDEPNKNTTEHAHLEDGVFRLHIGVEHSPAGLYPSVCVSDAWLPDPLSLANTAQALPWQNPPPTFLFVNAEHDGMAIDNNPKLPDLRFSIEIDPPIIMPWSVASAIYQSVGMAAPQTMVQQAWHSLLLNPASTAPFDATTDSLEATAERTVLVCRDGKEEEVAHAYTVEVVKPDSAHKLEKLPFSHPQQLVEMLPTLRQWACFGSLVRAVIPDAAAVSTKDSAVKDSVQNFDGTTKTQVSFSLSDLLTPPASPEPFADRLPVHISLITSPAPTLSLSFPSATGGNATRSVTVRVLLNAELVVTGTESLADAEDHVAMDGVKEMDDKKMARALEVCGDLGVWVEWLRTRA
ncbi:hypothetical protein LTR08_002248 [Meristemomyces frigidus]|nr:hypothetical protein LTR08_002248 [Meristemomyces frigidus]